MTEPVNIGPPRDPQAADDAAIALEFFIMNLPGWPSYGRGGLKRGRQSLVWPTEKAYQWLKDHPTS